MKKLTMLTVVVAISSMSNLFAHVKNCSQHSLSVKLIPGDETSYNLVGELCWKGQLEGKEAVQLLVHGATYGKNYWDFNDGNKSRSYVNTAIRRGHVTFSYDRLGAGNSDKPAAILVNVDNSAYVNSQVVQALRNGTFGKSFSKITQVGHSFGSLISVASASTYQDIDALVLTGFAHQATEQANTGTGNSVYPAMLDPKFSGIITDPNYFTTIPGTRAGLFFYAPKTSPAVLTADEDQKDLFPLGLVLDIGRHFSTESLAINVPVYMIMGDEDYIYCGENIDCSDPATFQAYEQNFFTTQVDTKIVKKLGHSLHLHKNSKKVYAKMLNWIESH